MAKGQAEKDVLVLDDEPEYLTWMTDYFEKKKLKVISCKTLDDAMQKLAEKKFRLFIVDMNIPASDALVAPRSTTLPLASRYPGLIFAQEARTRGYGAHSVIGYTVHNDDSLAAELNKLYCRYVLKGRPRVIKGVIDKSLEPIPPSAISKK